MKKQRENEGRSRIKTWEKVKKDLKGRFLLENYRMEMFMKIHSLEQQLEISVEEYTVEFEKLMMKSDMVELEEQTIARFLRGLKKETGNVVRL